MPVYRVKLFLAARPADPICEATLELPNGPNDWSVRGSFVPDVAIEANDYIVQLPKSALPRQRFTISESAHGGYNLVRIT
jgi:hypothetical protein